MHYGSLNVHNNIIIFKIIIKKKQSLNWKLSPFSLISLQIAAVFCICGALAREAAEAADGEPALELVAAPAAAVADLLHEETGSWIAANGGWVSQSTVTSIN